MRREEEKKRVEEGGGKGKKEDEKAKWKQTRLQELSRTSLVAIHCTKSA